MRYYLDLEFIENGMLHFPIIVSIGIVAQDGRELYLERAGVDWAQANEWVLVNVKPHLTMKEEERFSVFEMGAVIEQWIGDDVPEFWGYYADYDWVLTAALFGRMVDLPEGWPMFCHDLKQLAEMLGNPELPKQDSTEHHALEDARWNREVHLFLTRYKAMMELGQ